MSQGWWIRWFPWISLATCSSLWLARWPTFPLGIDPWYHVFVARQLANAGGPIIYEWWANAPAGHPHAYPPVLHVLLAGLLALGVSPVTAVRLVSAVLMPCLLGTIFVVMARLTTRSVAVASLLMAILPFSWFVQITGVLAAGLALIELLWLLVAIQERRVVAASCLITLLFYTHHGLGLVGVASLMMIALLKGVAPRTAVFTSLGWGLVLVLPWLGRLGSYAKGAVLGVTQLRAMHENNTFAIVPALYLLAAIGAWRCVKWRGSSLLLLGLWLGFCPMAYPYTFRWLSGEGLLPVVLMSGFGLEGCWAWLTKRWQHRASDWLVLLTFTMLVAVAPSILIGPSGEPAPSRTPDAFAARVAKKSVRVLWLDTAPFRLLNWPSAAHQELELQLYSPQTAALAEMVSALSQPGEIVWSNAKYAGFLVAALANRPTAVMELSKALQLEKIGAAHLIVWFKVPQLPETLELPALLSRYRLHLVGETDLALIFRNPGASQLAHEPQAVIPLWLAFVLLCLLLGVALWDFRRRFR